MKMSIIVYVGAALGLINAAVAVWECNVSAALGWACTTLWCLAAAGE